MAGLGQFEEDQQPKFNPVFIGVASYGTVGHVPPRLSAIIFFSSLRSRAKSITANLSGSVFSIALKTREIGNERRSVTLTEIVLFLFLAGALPNPTGGAYDAT